MAIDGEKDMSWLMIICSMKMPDPDCIAAPLPGAYSSRLSFWRNLGQLDRSEFCASIVYSAEVRHGNGFDPKSGSRLWASSLNASLAFPLDVPLSGLDSTAAAFLPVRRRTSVINPQYFLVEIAFTRSYSEDNCTHSSSSVFD